MLPSFTSRFLAKIITEGERTAAFLHLSFCGQNRAFLHLSVCGQNRRGERSAAFLRLSVSGIRGVRGVRPSFTFGFVAKTEGVKGVRSSFRGLKKVQYCCLPSPLGFCQNRGVKGPRPSFTSFCGQNRGVKGARPSFTFRFVGKTGGVKGARPSFRGVKGVQDCCLPSPLGFWPERTAAFLHLAFCGQNRGVKGARPSFTSRFVAKTEGVKGARSSFRGVKGVQDCCLPSPLGFWPKSKPRGERTAAFLHLSFCGQNRGVKGAPKPKG